jgi:DNA-binding transcriptional regulator YbjK
VTVTRATDRREHLADAVIATLARDGMRGLTHRAVDHVAGVPDGSTSYYFRTRQALLRAAVERLAELDAADLLDRLVPPASADLDEVAGALARLVEQWVTTGRDRMLARYELALEANRRPDLHEVFVAEGARLRALAEAMLSVAGASDAARQAPLLVASLDGLVFDHLAGAGALDLTRDELRAAMAALLRASLEA